MLRKKHVKEPTLLRPPARAAQRRLYLVGRRYDGCDGVSYRGRYRNECRDIRKNTFCLIFHWRAGYLSVGQKLV
jgi:hypothetical protein